MYLPNTIPQTKILKERICPAQIIHLKGFEMNHRNLVILTRLIMEVRYMKNVDEEIRYLYAKGYYIWQIANEVGVSEYYVVKTLGLN